MNEKQPENDDRSSVKEETTTDVQMETDQPEKVEVIDAVPTGESADATDPQTVTVAPADILAAAAPSLANQEQVDVNQKTDSVSQNSDSVKLNAPRTGTKRAGSETGRTSTRIPSVLRTWPL